jgi:hypothetical protein
VVSRTSYLPLSTADLNSREVQLDKSSFDATLSYNNFDDAIAPVFPEKYNVFCAYSDDSTGDVTVSYLMTCLVDIQRTRMEIQV